MKPLLVDFSFVTAPAFWCGLCLVIGLWLGQKWGRVREAKRIFSSKRYAARREAQLRRKQNPVDELLGGPMSSRGGAFYYAAPQRWPSTRGGRG